MFKLGGLARSTIKVFGLHAVRLLTQLIWVILLARGLGAAGYGGFSGVASLAMALSGLVGLGLALRMYQDVARNQNCYSLRWGQAWQATIWSGLGIGLAFVLFASWFFEEFGLGILLAIALSEIFFIPIATQVAFAFAAHGQMARSAAVPVVISVFRVLAALTLLFILGGVGVEGYVVLHVLATGLAVGILLLLKRHALPVDIFPVKIGARDLRSGVGFSAVWASGMALNSIDKAVALRAGGAELAGNYTAAYRFASLSALPVDALVTAVMPRLFRAGAGGSEHPRLIGLLGMVAAAYGLAAGALVWYTAELVPLVLGPDFEQVVGALGLIAAFVPLYCVRIVGASALLGFGLRSWRVWCEVSALLTLVMLGLWRIPIAGLEGAVQALIGAELLLAAVVWPRLWIEMIRRRKPSS